MLIIHGVKRDKIPLGIVAELCNRCHDIRPALIHRISQYHHVYFVPVGSKKELGYEVTCTACRQTISAEEVPYQSYCPNDPGDLGLLVEMTNPDAIARLEARIDLEDRLARGAATHADRVTLFTDIISAAGLPVQAKLHNALPTTALLLAATIVCLPFTIVFATLPHPDPFVICSTGAAGLIFLIFFLRSAATGKQRFLRKKIIPSLAADLAQYNPTKPELAEALALLAKNKLTLATKLKPNTLFYAIRSPLPAAGRAGEGEAKSRV